ncbi:putative ATP-dependent RNA helicase kurz [Lucilia cuprina]|uniref:RNA helicase n=1 Tax=Lucilia cuprina TaxID=7375 RepID=A0A0L0C4Q4_LUCCU|nr:putative ATP-dependent RNA helicase kurz [Lucilia cuprina]KNC27353.1 putative ATP-dependent RNA helicase kurz [Lucilia cuprina]
MGKKVYNAKARQNPQTIVVDNSALKDVKLELSELAEGSGAGYDESNALILPSQKRATKIKVEHRQNVKILTKKQRKHLQAIVDKKKKKEGRADLLEALAKVQVSETELKQYTSISQVQTVGVKKLDSLEELMAKKQQRQQNVKVAVGGKISSIKGAAKRKLLMEEEAELNAKRKNPNIVGMEEDDDDETTDEEEEEKEKEEVNQDPKEEVNEIKETIKEEQQQEKPITSKKLEETPKKETPKSLAPARPTVYVPVVRDPEIQAARLKLPILAEEQQVMEVINENNIIIVAGETGSGKTTQIPQFLYEAGYCENGKLIGITEPRRVAAIAMSKRVAHEMSLSEKEVSYLIRFEGNVTPETKIKFMTDGVLLKEIESDFLLKNYSVIILDEAHERSSYTDILVGLLSRIVPLRLKRGGNPLKLIIMSATLRVEDFTSNSRLFKIPPPLIKVEARQFPVTIHFQKRTPDNYVEEAYRKTVKIHSKLPEGGILIFVTGQQEVNQLVRKLRRTFPYKKLDDSKKAEKEKSAEDKDNKNEEEKDVDQDKPDTDDEFDMKRAIRNVRKSKKKFLSQLALPKINLDDYKLPGDDTEADLLENQDSDAENADVDDLDDEEDDENPNVMDEDVAASTTKQPLWVLPLYSLLSSEKQNRIFQPAPEGTRVCVVSTNVAETSLTIPNIKYVVDCGKQKTRLYDKITGVSAFVVTYTSKASADQRAGRAGRVSAGHCYRLYSSAVYNDEFEDFSVPDIQKKPVDDLMLQMRCMGIDRVINFPFPSPPDTVQLQAAEKRLIILGALEKVNEPSSSLKEIPPKVSRLGHIISRFPVAPRFGKMLALSHQQNLLSYTVCLVAALSVQEVLMEVNFDREKDEAALTLGKWQKKRQSWASTGNYQLLGDPMVLLRAVGAAEYAGSKGELVKFCAENGLRHKAITEVRKLRVQLTNEINLSINNVNLSVDPSMAPPTDAQARFLRQILLAGMGDKVARKVSLADISDKEEKRKLKYAYNCLDMEEPVFMHSSSVLKQKLPEWVIYQEAYEIQNGDSTKMFIRGITAIEPEWLLLYAPLLCNIRSIKEEPLPRYKAEEGKVYCFVDATFGKAGWELPLTEIEMPMEEKAFCYFAMFVLDGQVCPQLLPFKSKLKSTPSSLTKSWSNLNENIMKFKRCFISKRINTREKLFETWNNNPNFLLEEYQNMLYDVSLSELTPIWPPTKLD